jgi:hypothetical protein
MSLSRVAMITSSGCGCSCESAWACSVSAARSAPPVPRLWTWPSIAGFTWRRRRYTLFTWGLVPVAQELAFQSDSSPVPSPVMSECPRAAMESG